MDCFLKSQPTIHSKLLSTSLLSRVSPPCVICAVKTDSLNIPAIKMYIVKTGFMKK